ncbi:MAG: outer membrane protein assembly factor BamC [Spongiibacteraceae bacterium]
MKLLLKLVIVAVVLLSLSACSWLLGDDGTFRDRGNDYRKATIEAPLELPSGMDSDSMDDSYAIPTISDRTSLGDKFEIPKPEPLAEDIDQDSVRINSLGNQTWILTDGAPGQIWPRLRGFLSLNQLGVQRADAAAGIIETTWLQPAGEETFRERYRLRIEQGVQRGTSEVYVLQSDTRSGSEDWPSVSNNPEREQIMTKELAQYLADRSAAVAVSMLAQQTIDSSGKITLEESSNAETFIKLTLPFSRAWASVGLALEKSKFKVDDLDRSEQVYRVHYLDTVEAEKNSGFFSWLFSWADSDKDADEQGIAYYVRVKEIDDKSAAITIERQSGKTMDKVETERLLKLLKRHIT